MFWFILRYDSRRWLTSLPQFQSLLRLEPLAVALLFFPSLVLSLSSNRKSSPHIRYSLFCSSLFNFVSPPFLSRV